MKKFRFTLEAVRTLRQRQEQQALEDYARALLARHEAFRRLEAVEQEIAGGWAEFRRRLAEGCAASEMAGMKLSENVLQERRRAADSELQERETQAHDALRAMLAARREREIVDKCREKQQQTHAVDGARQEMKLMDELGARRIAPSAAWRNRSDF